MHFTPLPLIRVFLAADDEDDYKLVQALLSKSAIADYSLEREASFQAALSRVSGFAYDIYMVVYRSGKNSGLELIRKMVGKGCRKPIILVTDQRSHESDVGAMKTGASDCLRKAQLPAGMLDRAILRAIEGKRDESVIAGAREEWEYTLNVMCDQIMIIDRQFRILFRSYPLLVVSFMSVAAMARTGTGGGGTGGGGGRETTAVNNLSFPAIAVDGFAIVRVPVVKFDKVYDGSYPGLTADAVALLQSSGPWYAQKEVENVWQADFRMQGRNLSPTSTGAITLSR